MPAIWWKSELRFHLKGPFVTEVRASFFFFLKQLTTAQQQQPMFAVTIFGCITWQLHNLVLLLLNWFEQPGKQIRAAAGPSQRPPPRRTCPPAAAPEAVATASPSLHN